MGLGLMGHLPVVGLCSTVGVPGRHHHHLQKESQKTCGSGSEEKLVVQAKAAEQPFLRDPGTPFCAKVHVACFELLLGFASARKPKGLFS